VVVEAAVVDAEEEGNMNNTLSCQLCHKKTDAEMGKTCKTCGMILEDSGKDFCSKACRNIYVRLRRIN
jgi:hypothetical protein